MVEWARPQFSRRTVNQAGDSLIGTDPLAAYRALNVVNNWRSSHSFPLNTFQIAVRRYGRRVDPDVLVAQRIKRLPAIAAKLRNEPWLKLSQMQDIGGCRAVVNSVQAVANLVDIFRESEIKHESLREDNYIATPRATGYRGSHLVYKYHSDRVTHWNNLRIEIQIRSPLQHAWATAVETVSAFTGDALKANQGSEDWRRFFALMGSEMAIRENSPLVPGTPDNLTQIVEEIREHQISLNIVERLRSYQATIQQYLPRAPRGTQYFLITRDSTQSVNVLAYRGIVGLEQAYADYAREEAKSSTSDTVLVRVESLAQLQRAYPNYFLDTELFLREVTRVLA